MTRHAKRVVLVFALGLAVLVIGNIIAGLLSPGGALK